MTRFAIPLLVAGALLWGCSSATKCSVPRDCPSSQRCVGGECTDPGGSPPSALGEACRSTADCAAGLACQTAAQGFEGGFCTATCSGTTACATGACTAIAPAELCAPNCTSDSACRQGYGCCPSLGSVCVPLAACTPAACERPVVASVLDGGQVQQFGVHKVGEEITFTVPPNTGSLTIVQQAQLATLSIVYRGSVTDNSAVPMTVTMPDGGVVYDDRTFNPPSSADGGVDSSGAYAFYGGGTPSTAAFTLPDTSASLAAGVPAGSWKFVVNDYANECTFLAGCSDGGTAENTYDVSVVTNTAPPSPTLEVAFYIVTDAFNETTAATSASVARMVSTYKQIYAAAGITVNATFIDVSATAKAQYGTSISATATSPCDGLCQMFVLSKNRNRLSDGALLPPNTMNVFLVQALQNASGAGGGGTVVGIDGTIPGPASHNGTVQSGAVVSAADLFAVQGTGCRPGVMDLGSCGADEVAFIAAHETGHFLGLFHTTESGGDQFDPIADTPKCPCFNCSTSLDRAKCGTANPPFIQSDRCVAPASGCGGGNNLMFWFLKPGFSEPGVISTQQAQLMKLSPLAH